MVKKLLFAMVMILSVSVTNTEESPPTTGATTICGMMCLTSCARGSKSYYWCGQWSGKPKASGTTWDYCSNQNYTIYGEECRDRCSNREGTSYFWCHLKDGSWDYCSPSQSMGNSNYRCYWTPGGVAELVLWLSLLGLFVAFVSWICYYKYDCHKK